MRLSIARVSAGGHTPRQRAPDDAATRALRRARGAAWPWLCRAVLILGCVGILFGSSKPAGADTVFASGQVFASVGNSTVNVYDPTSGDLINTLNDGTDEPYTAGSAFDSSGNLYVTDDLNGDISEYSPDGTLDWASSPAGLTTPVARLRQPGQPLRGPAGARPTSPSSHPSGQTSARHRPGADRATGDDWIDLSSDECTFYYTTESTDIFRYNKCTNTQLPNFNVAPFTGDNAFEAAASSRTVTCSWPTRTSDILLDPNGNVIQTYSCASLPGLPGPALRHRLDPSGTSFWTGDAISGNIWQINIATGAVLQTITTQLGPTSTASRSTTSSRWPRRRHRSPRPRRRSTVSPSPATSPRRRRSRPC